MNKRQMHCVAHPHQPSRGLVGARNIIMLPYSPSSSDFHCLRWAGSGVKDCETTFLAVAEITFSLTIDGSH